MLVHISVTGEHEYYILTWKNHKKVSSVERKTDSDGTELIGKRFSFNEFNAAIAFEKLNKDGGTSEELYKFDLHVSMCQQFGCNFLLIDSSKLLLSPPSVLQFESC